MFSPSREKARLSNVDVRHIPLKNRKAEHDRFRALCGRKRRSGTGCVTEIKSHLFEDCDPPRMVRRQKARPQCLTDAPAFHRWLDKQEFIGTNSLLLPPRSQQKTHHAFIMVSDRISGPSCIFPSYTWAPFQSKWGRAKTAVASNRAAAVSSIESCHFLLCHRRILETVMNKHFASCYSECTPDNRIHRCLHSHLQKQNQHYEVYGNFSGP